MSTSLLSLLVFVIAMLYSSAGFGGASGYLIAMSFFNVPTNVMSSSALVLNIFVSSISFTSYLRAGHFRPRLLFPFLITSVPAAFIGGTIKISEQTYTTLLYVVLSYLAIRMVLAPTLTEALHWKPRPIPIWAALVSGAAIGLLSGMLGIGGGIFLSPLIILMQWGNSKQAAASAGGFIAINSISGLVGRFSNGTLAFGGFGISMLIVGLLGALIGSQLGADQIFRIWSPPHIGNHPHHCRDYVLVQFSKMNHPRSNLRILIRGANDVGSAVAHRLFTAGYAVVIHEIPLPASTRRKMSFTDAVFDGHAMLDGVEAQATTTISVLEAMASHQVIPVTTDNFLALHEILKPNILIDARMRKHSQPELQIHFAALTIGLGPNFVAGTTTHLVIETARGDSLGRMIDQGSASPLRGEPNEIEGHARDRYVYAPISGIFHTSFQIGNRVESRQEVARIDSSPLFAPITGILRGLTHDAVPVIQKTKVIEVDPRTYGNAQISGIAKRPGRIAQGVLSVIQNWEEKNVH